MITRRIHNVSGRGPSCFRCRATVGAETVIDNATFSVSSQTSQIMRKASGIYGNTSAYKVCQGLKVGNRLSIKSGVGRTMLTIPQHNTKLHAIVQPLRNETSGPAASSTTFVINLGPSIYRQDSVPILFQISWYCAAVCFVHNHGASNIAA